MRNALVPLIAALAVCGAATVAMIATTARAEQSGHKPTMIALVTPQPEPPPRTEAPLGLRNVMVEPGRGQICNELYARRAGELAFLEAKLSLNAKQAPLFARWKQASLDVAKQHEGDCVQQSRLRPRDQRLSVVDRLAMEEDMLKKRLSDIGVERPVLAALYNSLTPVQKDEFGRGGMRPMRMMMGMMDRHPGMRTMRMAPGPMPGPMDNQPQPPAQ